MIKDSCFDCVFGGLPKCLHQCPKCRWRHQGLNLQPEMPLETRKSHAFSRKPSKRHQSLIHSARNPDPSAGRGQRPRKHSSTRLTKKQPNHNENSCFDYVFGGLQEMSAPVPQMPLETPKSQPFSRKCRWRHQSLIHSAGNLVGRVEGAGYG